MRVFLVLIISATMVLGQIFQPNTRPLWHHLLIQELSRGSRTPEKLSIEPVVTSYGGPTEEVGPLVEIDLDNPARIPNLGRGERDCRATFSLTSFELLSHVGENDCQFEVERALPSICKLELEFNTFEWGNEVEVKDPESENNPCPEASLVIGSGPSIVLATFCGNHSGQTREVDFPPNAETVFFTFDSKDLNNRTNYNVTVRQIDCRLTVGGGVPRQDLQVEPVYVPGVEYEDLIKDTEREPQVNCNRAYREETFVIQSPNYPRGYPGNIECATIVYPVDDNICTLELRFDEFKVEPSASIDECANDYLEIGDEKESMTRPERYCGIFTGIRLVEMRALKKFVFHANEAANDVGFSIFVKQLPCESPATIDPPPRTPEPTTSTFEPEFPDPTTTITVTSTATPVPELTDFPEPPVTQPIQCQTTEEYQTPTEPQPTYQAPGTSIEVDYDYNYNPFLPNSPVPVVVSTSRPTYCSRTYLTAGPVRLTSPGYPNAYLNDDDCLYTMQFTRSDICFLQVDFHNFGLQRSIDCQGDRLEISGNRLCGLLTGTVLYPVDAGAFSWPLVFKTDSAVRNSEIPKFSGFDITIKQIPCTNNAVVSDPGEQDSYGVPIGQVLGSQETVVSVGRNPSISRPPFNAIPVEYQPDFNVDFPIAPSRPTFNQHAQSRPNFVQNNFPTATRPNFNPRPTARPPFVTPVAGPLSSKFPGSLNFHHVHRPPVFAGDDPSVPTSGYGIPSGYPITSRPLYRPPKPSYNRPLGGRKPIDFLGPLRSIARVKVEAIRSAFRIFRLPKGLGHPFRFGRLKQKRPSYGAPKPTYRPTSRPNYRPQPEYGAPFISPRADNETTTTCPLYRDQDRTVITSPGYPTDYPDDVDCTVIISPDDDSSCGFDLNFVDFIVEDSTYCAQDFVDIGGKRFCGQKSESQIFANAGQPLAIRFKTDSHGATRGFYIEVTEKASCPEP